MPVTETGVIQQPMTDTKTFLRNTDSSATGRDIIRTLSPRARLRYEGICAYDLRGDGLRRAVLARREEVREQRDELIRQKHVVAENIRKSGIVPVREVIDPDDSNRKNLVEVDWESQYDTPIREAKRTLKELHTVQFQQLLVPIIEKYFGDRRASTSLADCKLPAPKPTKGEDHKIFLERIRAEHDAAKAALDKVLRAQRPSAEAGQNLRSHFARIKARGAPLLGDLFRGFRIDANGNFQVRPQNQGKIEFAQCTTNVLDVYKEPLLIPDAVAFICWLMPDVVEARLLEAVAARARDERAVAFADRPAKIAQAKSAVLWAARAEEEAILFCEAAGLNATRRDTHPFVLLGVEVAQNPASVV